MRAAAGIGLKVHSSVLNAALDEAPDKPLYHYTDQNGLLGIIKSKEIWATHHQCLNDAQEFVHAKELFRGEIAMGAPADPLLAQMLHTLNGEGFEGVNLFVASLSEDPDSLAQWRAYGVRRLAFPWALRWTG